MTICGDFCPFKACPGCEFPGGAQQDSNTIAGRVESGKDERPAALTADRSSHSDSPQRKGGMAR